MALIIGAQTRHAAYSTSWGDGRFLHFSYAVQEGDRDEDGIAIPANALALNGGTITDADGTAAADLAHAAESPGQHGGKVDGSLVTVPVVETISLISFPARGDTYELGEMVEGAGPAAEWTLCGSAYAKHIPTDRAVAIRGPEDPRTRGPEPVFPIVVFLVGQKYFIEGVTLTGMKT